jgi:hypothetical protein
MSNMSSLHLDIVEMFEAGCSRGFMIGEVMSTYGIPAKEAIRFIDSVVGELNEINEEAAYND